MRILLLSLSLFIAQNTLTNGTMTNAMKLTAAGITLSAGSGVVTELLYPTPIPKNPSENYGAGNIFVAVGTGAFNVAMAFYHSGMQINKYAPFCILVGSTYGHLFAATGTRYIKKFLS